MALTNIQTDRLLQDDVQTVTSSATTLTINWALGQYVILTLSASLSSTLTISNWPVNTAATLILEVRNGGAFSIGATSWAGALWAGGTAPTVTSGSGKKDIFLLHTGDAGTTVYGSIIGQDYH